MKKLWNKVKEVFSSKPKEIGLTLQQWTDKLHREIKEDQQCCDGCDCSAGELITAREAVLPAVPSPVVTLVVEPAEPVLSKKRTRKVKRKVPSFKKSKKRK